MITRLLPLALLFLLSLTSCSLLPPQKLSFEEDHSLIVTEDNTRGLKLRVRGFLTSSFAVATSIRSTAHGPTLDLTLRAGWVRSGYTGRFDCIFRVPDTVDEVRIGTTRTLIWDRRSGSRFPVSRQAPLHKKVPHSKKSLIDNLLESGAYVFDWDAWLKGTSTHPVSLPVPGKVSLRNTSCNDDLWMSPAPSRSRTTGALHP